MYWTLFLLYTTAWYISGYDIPRSSLVYVQRVGSCAPCRILVCCKKRKATTKVYGVWSGDLFFFVFTSIWEQVFLLMSSVFSRFLAITSVYTCLLLEDDAGGPVDLHVAKTAVYCCFEGLYHSLLACICRRISPVSLYRLSLSSSCCFRSASYTRLSMSRLKWTDETASAVA